MTNQEINELVGKRLGWTPNPNSRYKSNMEHSWCNPFGSPQLLPTFCDSISDAWQIVDAGGVDGVLKTPYGWIAGTYHKEYSHSIPANTASMAICLELLRGENLK